MVKCDGCKNGEHIKCHLIDCACNHEIEKKIKVVYFRKGKEANGWVPIWLVDDQGEQVNTEPVCTVPVEFHSWFPDWLEVQTAVLDR